MCGDAGGPCVLLEVDEESLMGVTISNCWWGSLHLLCAWGGGTCAMREKGGKDGCGRSRDCAAEVSGYMGLCWCACRCVLGLCTGERVKGVKLQILVF